MARNHILRPFERAVTGGLFSTMLAPVVCKGRRLEMSRLEARNFRDFFLRFREAARMYTSGRANMT